MPQQNANAGVKSQKAIVCCRNCEVDYEQRNAQTYDLVMNGRYYDHQELIRENAVGRSTIAARDRVLQPKGLLPTRSPWYSGNPAFDPFRMTPQEPAHIVPNGLGTYLYLFILV